MRPETGRKAAGSLPDQRQCLMDKCRAWNLGSNPSCHLDLSFLICKRPFIILSLWAAVSMDG